MARTSKLIVGTLLAVAVGLGLWGTLAYTRETLMGDEANPASRSTQVSESPPLQQGSAIADARPLRGITQLVNQLHRVGLREVLVLNKGQPKRLSVTFTGEQDVAAHSFYEVRGRTVSVGQIFGAPLPPSGGLVRLSPDRTAVEVDDVLYWSERGFILTLASDSKELAGRLRWRSP
jgi:hypothetical protein